MIERWNRSASVALLIATGLGFCCRSAGRPSSTDDRLKAFVEAEAARPLLEDGRAELLEYLRAFPRVRYDLRPTRDGLSYFIEKDGPLGGIKQVLSKGEVWEGDFTELMGRFVRPGSVVVDAGAYIGTHAMALARLAGGDVRVYAFEPQRKVFRELVHNLIENGVENVVPLRFALGAEVAAIEMDPPSGGQEATVGVGRGGDRVELRTLDSFNLDNVSFIKIDVEGYEGPVLDGARQTLARNGRPPLLVEIQRAADYWTASPELQVRIEETLDRIEDCGYAVTPLAHRDYLALPAPAYAAGSVLSFREGGGGELFRSRWWTEPDRWGAWALGRGADIVLVLSAPPAGDLVLTGVFKVPAAGGPDMRGVDVIVGGRRVERWSLRSGTPERRTAVIPAGLAGSFAGTPVLRIRFRVDRPAAPEASKNKRLQALGLRTLSVSER